LQRLSLSCLQTLPPSPQTDAALSLVSSWSTSASNILAYSTLQNREAFCEVCWVPAVGCIFSPTHRPLAASQSCETYFKLVEHSLSTVKAKGVELSSAATASLSEALADARAKLSDGSTIALARVSAAWEALLAQPQVSAALEKAKPLVQSALERAKAACEHVTATHAYGKYVAPRLQYVKSQPAVHNILQRLQPLVAAN
jgi:hypothetical protein